MYDFAIAEFQFSELPNEFVPMAMAYEPKKDIPGPFWAVIFNGKVQGIYLDIKDAVAHLLQIKAEVEAGNKPRRKQSLADVATAKRFLEQRLEEIDRNKSSDLGKTI
jgi:hypothetical protein